MGQKRFINNLRKKLQARDYSKEEIDKLVSSHTLAHKAKVEKELTRQATYLQVINTNQLEREQAYENRKLVKAGLRESYRQRKNRLNKERRDVLTSNKQ